MNMSDSPIATQAAALTALLATVTSLTNELARTKAIDPERFAAGLDELLSRSADEKSPIAKMMRDSIAEMMKTTARDGASL